jgi:molybdate transport system ATP-binding protein
MTALLAGNPVFDIDVTLQRGDFTGRFAFVSDHAATALVGPSGQGKTSLLFAIAGLVRPLAGHIRLNGRSLFDAAAGIDVPARARNLGLAFQDVRLFPHLDVRANLGYAGRASAAEIADMAQQLGLAPLLARWPRHLSGGEARRVALGRALLARPAALLLDEPCAHLDAARAAGVLTLVAAASRTTPVLLITHDPAEAAAINAISVGFS